MKLQNKLTVLINKQRALKGGSKMKRKIAVLLTVALIGASLFGCGGTSEGTAKDAQEETEAAGSEETSAEAEETSSEGPNIVFIAKGVADYWSVVAGGFESAAEENGLKGTVIYPSEETTSKQVDTMYDIINSKPDAIVLAPIDADPLSVPCKAAMDAGIPVVLVDTGISTEDYVTAFATDNKAAGAATAEKMAEELGGKGKVYIFAGSPASTSGSARVEGFTEYMEENCPDIEVLGCLYSDSNMALATSQTVDVLTANPDLAGIFAADETRSSGCSAALIQLGKENDIIVAGFDANSDTVALMEQGVINFMTVQQPYMMGYMGYNAALAALNGEQQERTTLDTGCTVVTQENMNEPEMQKILFPLDHMND